MTEQNTIVVGPVTLSTIKPDAIKSLYQYPFLAVEPTDPETAKTSTVLYTIKVDEAALHEYNLSHLSNLVSKMIQNIEGGLDDNDNPHFVNIRQLYRVDFIKQEPQLHLSKQINGSIEMAAGLTVMFGDEKWFGFGPNLRNVLFKGVVAIGDEQTTFAAVSDVEVKGLTLKRSTLERELRETFLMAFPVFMPLAVVFEITESKFD